MDSEERRSPMRAGCVRIALLLAAAAMIWIATPSIVSAKEEPLPGTIKIDRKYSEKELKAMAKITLDQADSIALGAVEGPAADKTVVEHELEVEGGVLVYSVEVKVKGKAGVQELEMDAGEGKGLKTG